MDEFHFGTLRGVSAEGVADFGASNAMPIFKRESHLNAFKSKQEGRPVHDAVDMVRVIMPGERDEAYLEVNEGHKMRWPKQWEAFAAGLEQVAVGTPLAVLFPSQPDLVDGLKGSKFHTVEQLAEASDTQLNAIGMGAREWHEKAKKFLAYSKDAGKFHALEERATKAEEESKRSRETISALEKRLAEIEKRHAK